MSDDYEAKIVADGVVVGDSYEEEYATPQGKAPEPTQVQEPVQAALRTVVQALVGLLAGWLTQRYGVELLPAARDALSLLAFAALSALAARVMAIPQVNAALTLVGLGAERRA